MLIPLDSGDVPLQLNRPGKWIPVPFHFAFRLKKEKHLFN